MGQELAGVVGKENVAVLHSGSFASDLLVYHGCRHKILVHIYTTEKQKGQNESAAHLFQLQKTKVKK